MKLSESDIKAVANRRFWAESPRFWKVIGILLGGLILSIILNEITDHALSAVPAFLGFGYLIWVCFKCYRYEKAFLAEWKAKRKGL